MLEVVVEPHLILLCQFMIDIVEEQKDWTCFQTPPKWVGPPRPPSHTFHLTYAYSYCIFGCYFCNSLFLEYKFLENWDYRYISMYKVEKITNTQENKCDIMFWGP